jgi:hypothetical protein
MFSNNSVWFKCGVCGYEWKEEDIDFIKVSWFDDSFVVRCHECKNEVYKPPKEDINAGFIPC